MLKFFRKKKVGPKSNVISKPSELKHIAFIMDGNGRWAQRKGLPREYGHYTGASVFKEITQYCSDIGIKTVTVYAFSTENWKRPKKEVDALMKLFSEYIDDIMESYAEKKIHIVFLGNKSIFPQEYIEKMEKLEELSAVYENTLNVAINYGGRDDILYAVNRLLASGKGVATEEDISHNLYTAHCSDPDLIVRTGGEYRLSNFLLWQGAYSELYFTDVLWPDMSPKEIDKAVAFFNSRKRRFGGV